MVADLARAKEAVQKAGLDPAAVQVIKRNVFRGMKDMDGFRRMGDMIPGTKSGS
mgnify:CR=1 FL=1